MAIYGVNQGSEYLPTIAWRGVDTSVGGQGDRARQGVKTLSIDVAKISNLSGSQRFPLDLTTRRLWMEGWNLILETAMEIAMVGPWWDQ